MKAPTTCLYCDGHGNSSAGGSCGFCNRGRPLDTQPDWDASWGARLAAVSEVVETPRKDGEQ